jgi:HPt (histidine-containing phosphotransfer) domain-containing protein
MIELLSGRVVRVSAPPLVPVERPIDLEHLSRMTLGERGLEREVLKLFDHQAQMLMERMRQSCLANVAAAAHTLMGSARGIGAWSVARAAEQVEVAAATEGSAIDAAIGALSTSVAEARAVIADLLRAH